MGNWNNCYRDGPLETWTVRHSAGTRRTRQGLPMWCRMQKCRDAKMQGIRRWEWQDRRDQGRTRRLKSPQTTREKVWKIGQHGGED